MSGWRARHSLADRYYRAGVLRTEAGPDDRAGSNLLPRRRNARAFGMVPGNLEQPSEAGLVLCGAGDVEWGDDRHAAVFWRALQSLQAGDCARVGQRAR